MSTVVQPRPTLGPPRPWRFPAARRTVLGNGLTLVTCHLPGRPILSAQLVVDAPIDLDPAGREGLASLVVSLLDEGTASLSASAFANALAAHGATFAAHAGQEGTVVGVSAPASRFAGALRLLADAVTAPAFAPSEFERAKAQTLQGIRAMLANPAVRAGQAFAAALYPSTSRLSRPAAGSIESVSALQLDDVRTSWARNADPATSTLVVAGDFTGLDLEALAGTAFGAWTPTGRAVVVPVAPVLRSSPGIIVVDRPGSVQTQLYAGHRGVSRDHADYPVLAVAGQVLGAGLTGRIDALLREEKGYTYGFRTQFAPNRVGGAFVSAGGLETSTTAAAVGDLVGVLTTAVTGGITAAERDQAVDYLVGVSPLRWETAAAVASQVAAQVGNGLPDGWVDTYLDGFRTSTASSVSAALAAHLHLDELFVVAVGDASQIAGPLGELGLGPVEVLAG